MVASGIPAALLDRLIGTGDLAIAQRSIPARGAL
jgi:hypothetical protein